MSFGLTQAFFPFFFFAKGSALPLLPWEMGCLLRRPYRQVCRRGCAAGMPRPKGRAEPGLLYVARRFLWNGAFPCWAY